MRASVRTVTSLQLNVKANANDSQQNKDQTAFQRVRERGADPKRKAPGSSRRFPIQAPQPAAR